MNRWDASDGLTGEIRQFLYYFSLSRDIIHLSMLPALHRPSFMITSNESRHFALMSYIWILSKIPKRMVTPVGELDRRLNTRKNISNRDPVWKMHDTYIYQNEHGCFQSAPYNSKCWWNDRLIHTHTHTHTGWNMLRKSKIGWDKCTVRLTKSEYEGQIRYRHELGHWFSFL